ncbi:murein hydrolase activator EnvC family protein [Heyndrickxia acidicola]|uniref:Peptidoglycan DD-metalloendopeptidase family protein n=1 Tax=Heyndrickxia acidicola TaxID=209389 RepID=A0ABU6MI93_9BACI|nr:peptidoglycan DD-metalloendopeptidase family protein [Heyndrickxia acidicola]MED1204402.1 peptidoglycan DD-metalloendopeptidase family protein [Heyndrickxia acidicola]
MKAQIKNLQMSIVDANEKIRDKQQQVDDTKQKINDLEAQIKVLQKRIDERNQLLKQRARAMQQNGTSASYLDVILTSKSFGEMLDRLSAVNTIVNADKDIMMQQKRDQDKLKAAQAEVEKKLSELQGMLNQLEKMKADFNAKKSQANALMQKLGQKKDDIEKEKLSMSEQNDLLSAQKAAIDKAIQMEKGRLADEAQKAAEQAKQQNESSLSSSGSSSLPPVTSGMFTRPAEGYISSGFGAREGTYSGFHYGVDIANPGSNVPIVATADGVVSRSYLSSSYGNCIFITHDINGKIYTTVYAHMSARLVGNGAVVHKGQQIGIMGSTGESTGQHLHFELYPGPWIPSHATAVDPTHYINF